MYIFLVFAILSSLNISSMQATCSAALSGEKLIKDGSLLDETSRQSKPQSQALKTEQSKALEISTDSETSSSSENTSPQLNINDLNDFRLEYNKYKILSQLSITKNVDEINHEIDEDLRSKLVATNQFMDSTGHSSNVSFFFLSSLTEHFLIK